MSPPRRAPLPVVGWREWVELPELCPTAIKAKVDTGARTSALHAFDLDVSERDGQHWASFELHPAQRSAAGAVRVDHEVLAFREVRSSDGRRERRPVIETNFGFGDTTWPVEITLTSRDAMGFRMLLGRTAVARRFLVNPGRSYVASSSIRPAAQNRAGGGKRRAAQRADNDRTTSERGNTRR